MLTILYAKILAEIERPEAYIIVAVFRELMSYWPWLTPNNGPVRYHPDLWRGPFPHQRRLR